VLELIPQFFLRLIEFSIWNAEIAKIRGISGRSVEKSCRHHAILLPFPPINFLRRLASPPFLSDRVNLILINYVLINTNAFSEQPLGRVWSVERGGGGFANGAVSFCAYFSAFILNEIEAGSSRKSEWKRRV